MPELWREGELGDLTGKLQVACNPT
jgi:hypothetical protein